MAGLKSISDSILHPIKYYKNNVTGTLELLNAMFENNIYKIIFSSSAATVYGEPHTLPIKEDHSLNPTNPYGKSKKIVEDILIDAFKFKYELEK